MCDWFRLWNSRWIEVRNQGESQILILNVWETRILVRIEWFDLQRTKVNDKNDNLNTKLRVFNGKNCNWWLIQMHILFGAQNIFDLVNDGYTPVIENAQETQRTVQYEIRKKNQKTLFYIHLWMDTKMFKSIYFLF